MQVELKEIVGCFHFCGVDIVQLITKIIGFCFQAHPGSVQDTLSHQSLGIWGSITLLSILAISLPTSAQEDHSWPVITADNATQLQSVAQIDFVDYVDEVGQFDTGWFAINENGNLTLLINTGGAIVQFSTNDHQADLLPIATKHDKMTMPTIIDMEITRHDNKIIALFLYLEKFMIFEQNTRVIDLPTNSTPLTVWYDESGHIWAEAIMISGEQVVYQFRPNAGSAIIYPYNPSNDPEAFIRIGRIEPPIAVTSSSDGVVKRWDLQRGEVTAQALVKNGPAVFGQMNAAGSHLTWRNPASDDVNLLSFETGENIVVAPLNGEYVQYFFVSRDADVVLGAVIQDEPIIVAWDVVTGERHELGTYRDCNRVPDMVRLSDDGTTLVVGCDTGLDIWRIVE